MRYYAREANIESLATGGAAVWAGIVIRSLPAPSSEWPPPRASFTYTLRFGADAVLPRPFHSPSTGLSYSPSTAEITPY